MRSVKKEITAVLLILLINVVTGALTVLISFLIDYSGKINHFFLKVATYFLLCFITFQIGRKIKSRAYKIMQQIIFLPLTFLSLYILAAIPVLSMQLSIGLYLVFAFLFPMILFRFDEHYHLTALKPETWTYIVLSSGVIFAFLFHYQIKLLVHKIIPFFHYGSERVKKFKLIELNNYVISVNNIRFVIFTLYLLYAMIVNIMSFQGSSFYDNQNIDKAVLQSFVTFIAFDRVLAAVRAAEFKPSELLDILKKSITGHYD